MRALLLTLVLALAACSAEDDSPEAQQARYQRDVSHAGEQARGKLGYFWEHFEKPEDGEYDFALKAALPRRDGQSGTEDAWLENIARSPEKLVGELSVDPKYLGDLRRGAIVEFSEKQIIDWAFWRGDKLLGHYTTRVMLPRLDQEQASGLRSVLTDNPN